jgi:hypothetical protein
MLETTRWDFNIAQLSWTLLAWPAKFRSFDRAWEVLLLPAEHRSGFLLYNASTPCGSAAVLMTIGRRPLLGISTH